MNAKPATYAKYQVIFKSPEERPKAASRSEKIRVLRESANKARNELIGWIEEHNMTEKVVQVGEPTTFNMLYIVSEPSAARELENAPSVDSVSPAGEVGVDLALTTR